MRWARAALRACGRPQPGAAAGLHYRGGRIRPDDDAVRGGSRRYARCSRRTPRPSRVDPPATGGEPLADPGRLGRQLAVLDVLVVPCAIEVDDRHEAAAGHEAEQEQPPLELGHQAGPRRGSIGRSLR